MHVGEARRALRARNIISKLLEVSRTTCGLGRTRVRIAAAAGRRIDAGLEDARSDMLGLSAGTYACVAYAPFRELSK